MSEYRLFQGTTVIVGDCVSFSWKGIAMLKFDWQSVGVKSIINVKGMGKRQPLRVANRWGLSRTRIYAFSRRVEY